MGRSQKWPDLRSPISKIRDICFVGTDDLIIFRKFQNFPWNIVAVARLESYFVVGSLDLTWWPDLTWHLVEIFTKVAEKMGDKVGEKPGGAARRRFFAILKKTWGGGGGRSNANPSRARVKEIGMPKTETNTFQTSTRHSFLCNVFHVRRLFITNEKGLAFHLLED